MKETTSEPVAGAGMRDDPCRKFVATPLSTFEIHGFQKQTALPAEE